MPLLEDVVNSPNEDETMALTPEKSKAEAKKESLPRCCSWKSFTRWKQNEKHFPALSHMAKKYLLPLCLQKEPSVLWDTL